MPVKAPRPGDLEPIETASRDEIAALQLQRLQWSVRHAYEHVPHYRAKFDAAGDRKSTRLNSSHIQKSRMPSSA